MDYIGKKVIVRTESAGVHFGTVAYLDGPIVDLTNSRRLWRWDVAPKGISLSDVAIHGPIGSRSRICAAVDVIRLTGAIEIIPTTTEAATVIEAAPVAE